MSYIILHFVLLPKLFFLQYPCVSSLNLRKRALAALQQPDLVETIDIGKRGIERKDSCSSIISTISSTSTMSIGTENTCDSFSSTSSAESSPVGKPQQSPSSHDSGIEPMVLFAPDSHCSLEETMGAGTDTITSAGSLLESPHAGACTTSVPATERSLSGTLGEEALLGEKHFADPTASGAPMRPRKASMPRRHSDPVILNTTIGRGELKDWFEESGRPELARRFTQNVVKADVKKKLRRRSAIATYVKNLARSAVAKYVKG